MRSGLGGMIADMSEAPSPAPAHVLVVDDETVLAGMVANYLQRAGFRTSVAHDGVRAVELALSESPDVVVLDLGLPGKDGLQVGTEKAWSAVNERKLPRMFVVSKLDEEHADFNKVFNQLKEKFGNSVIALQVPITENGKVKGIVDIPKMKAVYLTART